MGEGGRKGEGGDEYKSLPVRAIAKEDLRIKFYTLSHWFDDKRKRHVLAGNGFEKSSFLHRS